MSDGDSSNSDGSGETATATGSPRPTKKPRRLTAGMNDGSGEGGTVEAGGDGGGNNADAPAADGTSTAISGAAAAAAARAAAGEVAGGERSAPAAGRAAAAAPEPAADPVPVPGAAAGAAGAGGPPQVHVYDGDAKAATVFQDLHFYMTPFAVAHHEPDRARHLEGLSVRQVWEKFYNDAAAAKKKEKKGSQRWAHPLQAFTAAIGALYAPINKYYNSADMETKKYFAGIVLQAEYNCEFIERRVELGTALDPLMAPLTAAAATATGAANEPPFGGTINMEFLNGLRLDEKEERFLIPPTTVYVRDCMRVIFGLFQEDVRSNKEARAKSTVLIGSPGVGKSILFFLAALCQARKRMVVYYRVTNAEDEDVSVFVMTPVLEQPTSVSVWFSRNVSKGAIKNLSDVRFGLEGELDIRREEYYSYIDGPHHKQKKYLMAGMYDYFCASGGFPMYRNEERGKRLWILDGWTREEAIAGLAAVAGRDDEAQADSIYRLCGGKIRDMLVACDSPKTVQDEIDRRVRNAGGDAMTAPTFWSTYRSDDPSSPDGLRTMFLDRSMLLPEGDDPTEGAVVSWSDVFDAFKPELKAKGEEPQGQGGAPKWDVMYAYQIVDSEYARNELSKGRRPDR